MRVGFARSVSAMRGAIDERVRDAYPAGEVVAL
jgi:hypothetical protein